MLMSQWPRPRQPRAKARLPRQGDKIVDAGHTPYRGISWYETSDIFLIQPMIRTMPASDTANVQASPYKRADHSLAQPAEHIIQTLENGSAAAPGFRKFEINYT
jgi:hypothetical protein